MHEVKVAKIMHIHYQVQRTNVVSAETDLRHPWGRDQDFTDNGHSQETSDPSLPKKKEKKMPTKQRIGIDIEV